MKFKFIFLSAICCATLSVKAQQLVVEQSAETSTRFANTAWSKITFKNGGVQIWDEKSQMQEFDWNNIMRLYFDNASTSITPATSNQDKPYLIYNMQGQLVKRINGNSNPFDVLQSGAYIVKQEDATYKIRVK